MKATEFKKAWAGDEPYPARGDDTKRQVWVVTTRSPNSTDLGVKRVAAYFSEKLARAHAAKLVGAGSLIGLETIAVLDEPQCIHDWLGYQHPEGGVARHCKKCGHEDRTT